ncbi:ABC transporter ATP-binding protein [Denitromonas iodatirespirans]|uniref:ABC transporter ATP-binding protein n=1 Tax=Denitromonas iodatirespirans TaxID=2795389 RepID=A0A944DB87_DENI1|nr:ABC transporter ATP-binding protein [Denitromonas iodatirespirans]MBT0962172.1 ABC transporter ATP-binding protein [Denitromonas iodatirespirans]
MTTPLLQVSGLTAGYGRAQVLFGIDFSLGEGEVATLLGRNGMGRSTTVKCLFGLLPVGGGAIDFAGEPVAGLPSYRIAQRGLGLVPEGRQVFPNLTVEENLVATARERRAHGLAPWTLARVYEFFPRLHERRANLGSQLSGGEQQMLAIGRALLTNPRLLVLDEAAEGLAPLIRREIWQALARLKAEGLSLIVIDKNLGPLLELADRHHVIEKGKVVWSGDSAALRAEARVVYDYLGV